MTTELPTSTATDDEEGRADRSLPLLSAASTRGPVGRQSASSKHALLRGLRLRGNETQLTQVVAAVAQSDPAFAGAFVRLLLGVVRSDSRHEANAALMGDPPREMTCFVEHSVYDADDIELGRLDLRFDGGADFTLFVENKLHSGFGPEQLQRYRLALKNLPEDRLRAGLVAITRDVPSYGELSAGEEGWLGAVRWARLYDDGLASLPIADSDVALQWKLLLDILHDQGDLGLTSVDSDLIVAWSRYDEGQKHLTDILKNVRQRTLDVLRDRLNARYGAQRDPDAIAGLHSFGQRGQVPVKREKFTVYTSFRVPASTNRGAVNLSFLVNDGGEPVFSVDVAPWQAAERLDDEEPQLLAAVGKLARRGFKRATWKGDEVWWMEHKPADYLHALDVPARLIELIESDLDVIVSSGVLTYDLDAAAKGGRRGPPRVAGT